MDWRKLVIKMQRNSTFMIVKYKKTKTLSPATLFRVEVLKAIELNIPFDF